MEFQEKHLKMIPMMPGWLLGFCYLVAKVFYVVPCERRFASIKKERVCVNEPLHGKAMSWSVCDDLDRSQEIWRCF